MNKVSAADSTVAAYGSAIARFNEFQDSRNDPLFDDLTTVHVHDEHLQKLMLDFGRYLAKNDLTYGKDGKCIVASTKGDYFTKVKLALKEKFPNHAAWTIESSWYDPLKNDIEKGANRANILSTECYDSKILPFYPEVSDKYVRMKHRAAILHGNEEYATDLKSLCCLFIKQANEKVDLQGGPLQQRAWFVISMLAVGRGGEIKFQRYDEWYWDVFFEAPDATWTEIKTLTQHCMLFGPDKNSYLSDFYHAFGCFFSVENGLLRGRELDPAIHKNVVPSLHSYVNAGVAARLTKILRDHVSPALKDRTSSRSIRRGATTFLYSHEGVTEAQLNARGGWASDSNSRAYKETTPVLTIPAQNALAGWDDTQTPKYPPRLECLGSHALRAVEEFMDKLYMVDVPSFQVGGPLHPFLRACTAAMIMYHFDVANDYGPQNLVVEKVRRAATTAKICDGLRTEPVDVLRHWAGKIKADFLARNPDNLDPNMHSVKSLLVQTNRLLQRVLSEVQANRIASDGHTQTIEHLGNMTATLSHQVSNLQQGSPQRRRSPASLATSASNEGDCSGASLFIPNQVNLLQNASAAKGGSDQLVIETPAPATKRPGSPMLAIAVAQHQKKAHTFLSHSSTAELAGKSAKKTPLFQVLCDLYHRGHLKGTKETLRSISLTHLSERDKYKAAMELVECVVSDAQWIKLCTPGQSERDTIDTAKEIQFACITRLREWEEAADLRKPLENPNMARGKPYFIGLGTRVVAYKSKVGIVGHLLSKPVSGKLSSFFVKKQP